MQLFRHLQSLLARLLLARARRRRDRRMTNDVEALDSLVTDGIVTLFQSTLTLLGVVVILLALDAELAL